MSKARREAHQAQGVLRVLGPSDPAPCNSCGHTEPGSREDQDGSPEPQGEWRQNLAGDPYGMHWTGA